MILGCWYLTSSTVEGGFPQVRYEMILSVGQKHNLHVIRCICVPTFKSLYKSQTRLFLRHDLAILRMERPVQLTPVRADNYHFNEETADSEVCVFRMEIWQSMNFTLI